MENNIGLLKAVPSEQEIADAEKQLAQMKAQRELAKNQVLACLKNEDIINVITPGDAMGLIKLLQTKLRGAHKKVRGSPVPPELKDRLVRTLLEGDQTLAQIESSLGLSISYISRIKKELKDAGKLKIRRGVRNAYHNRAELASA